MNNFKKEKFKKFYRIIFKEDEKLYEVDKINLEKLISSNFFDINQKTGNNVITYIKSGITDIVLEKKRYSVLEFIRFKDFRRKYYKRIHERMNKKNQYILEQEYLKFEGELEDSIYY